MLTVRLLTPADAPAYRAVRLAALESDPLAFLTSTQEFGARLLEAVAERLTPSDGSATFGAFLNGELVGLLTLARETAPILAHKVNVFGVSVAPQARRQGCGDALLQAALAHARQWVGVTSLHLAVIETQGAAHKLYERHGFRVWGRQPDAVRRDGRVLAEDWMVLELSDYSR